MEEKLRIVFGILGILLCMVGVYLAIIDNSLLFIFSGTGLLFSNLQNK